MRNKIVVGNWKMNLAKTEATSLFQNISTYLEQIDFAAYQKVVIAPPAIHIETLNAIKSKAVLAAQNCFQLPNGAFTGEISAAMLASYHVEYCIVGHSERRQYFAESNCQIKEKIDTLLAQNIRPIFCCGESLDIRKSAEEKSFISNQIEESLFHLDANSINKVIIAYEPIWAIGTGVTASNHQAQEMHLHIRNLLAQKYTNQLADSMTLLYGGSCNAKNAKALFACPDIDGGLIGGASLVADDFCAIIKFLHD